MKNNEEKKDFSGAIVIALFLSLSWGVPSLIRGDGFINGIAENIEALITINYRNYWLRNL